MSRQCDGNKKRGNQIMKEETVYEEKILKYDL